MAAAITNVAIGRTKGMAGSVRSRLDISIAARAPGSRHSPCDALPSDPAAIAVNVVKAGPAPRLTAIARPAPDQLEPRRTGRTHSVRCAPSS